MKKPTIIFAVVVCLLCAALPAMGGDIHRAIEAGDVERVKQILASDPSAVSQPDDSQFRDLPIHVAAATGNVEIARLLLEAGAFIDAGDSDNSTALGVAAMRRYADMVSFLIGKGADVNRRDRKADCPLSFAVYGRDEAIIQQLLDAGADLYFRSPSGATLLHIAASRGLLAFTQHLLDNGADINARELGHGTPLTSAAVGGHAEIVKLLLARGADPNPVSGDDPPALVGTCWRNQVECAGILLENGAQVNYTAQFGNTALTYAAEVSSPEMIDLLIKHGASVNHQNDDGETPLIKASARGNTGAVGALVAAKADPNLGTDHGGRTALHLAALGGYLDAARLLTEAGAEVNASTPAGETPIQLARYYGHNQLAALLAERGADGGSENIDRSLAALGKVGKKEAVVWFLGQGGFAVKTRNHLLIFDYFNNGENPVSLGLCNGHINPAEISGEKVAVFASHSHGDHYNPAIFEWRNQVSDISYFLGLQAPDTLVYTYMPERMEESFGDMKVTTIHSTDAGVGEVVEVDGLTIFHPGDHANGRVGLMEEFTDEIDFLASRGIRPDICFMGIRGCSLGRPEEVKEGVEYTLKTLKPKVFIPMHAGNQGYVYREFIEEIKGQFASIQMVAPDNRGDHFVYRKGKIEDPRSDIIRQAAR